MERDDISNDQIRQRWFIDLDWYQLNNRSFSTMAQDRLCPKCRQRLQVEEGEISVTDLLSAIRDCCSKAPGFMNPKLPLLERVFRLFLSRGNQPLILTELTTQLSLYSNNPTSPSAPTLQRLLDNDRHYGFRRVL